MTGPTSPSLVAAWPPRTPEALRSLIAEPVVQESTAIEVKSELPVAKRNGDIAIDVCAMTVEGGLIIYGVEETPNRQLTEKPVHLAGTVERIANVVYALVAEPPLIDVYTVPLDEDSGFVVVHVPPSDRSPHMVQKKGEWRYYGRGPGGNRELTEGEVARLYEMRARVTETAVEITRYLDEAAPPQDSTDLVFLHVLIRPTVSDEGLLGRAWGEAATNPGRRIAEDVLAAKNAVRFDSGWAPTFSDVVGGSTVPTVNGWMIRRQDKPGAQFDIEVTHHGAIRFFTDASGQRTQPQGFDQPVLILRDAAAGRMVAHTIRFAGGLYSMAGYFGTADIHVLVKGARDAVSPLRLRWQLGLGETRANIPDPYHHRIRQTARTLLTDPIDTARSAIGPLLATLRQGGPDVFDEDI